MIERWERRPTLPEALAAFAPLVVAGAAAALVLRPGARGGRRAKTAL